MPDKRIEKIHKAILEMMNLVDFDKEEHRYIRKSDGKFLAGVSSIASLMPKEFLIPWAAKEAVTYLGYKSEKRTKEMLTKIKKATEEEYQDLLEEAKKSYCRKSDQAKLDGTDGHAYVEKYIKAKIRNKPIPKLENKLLERPIKEFIKWEKANVKQWVLSEARVVDIKNEFAGTLDAMAILKNDKLAIIDLKFANHIGADFHLQTAGYSLAFVNYGIKIDDRIIVRLPKTLEKKEFNPDTGEYITVKNNIEIGRSAFPLKFDIENFLHARALFRYANARKA